MSFVALAAIGVAVFVASLVSGVFCIAGGMIMLGVLLIFFDVPTAMVLFSLLAATGNAWRVVSWWGHVNWRSMWGYAAGGLIATVLMGFVAFVPSKAMVYLILGLIPYVIELLPRDHHPNIEWRGVPLLSGLVTTAIQLIGANGLFRHHRGGRGILRAVGVHSGGAAHDRRHHGGALSAGAHERPGIPALDAADHLCRQWGLPHARG